MRAKPPEIFSLDRLQTPIGTALLVTDADGVLRALDWEDYEPRMKELLRLHYGAVDAERGAGAGGDPGRRSQTISRATSSPEHDQMARRRHAVPAQGLERVAEEFRRARP